ncbi:hypothetical protein CYMTET_33650 [Cymbomonas tetramitiformis]|uniref:Uncharacterized protein n=1 Tax=Cymbomonas tetramitiformis TaxID=36881 RepID=A0AAE0KQR1_9CHLO|nr:hypothetical protein CYMTET_33650 [Cymbomonas tetramitiformis]
MLSLDLKDGYHMIGIHPAFQRHRETGQSYRNCAVGAGDTSGWQAGGAIDQAVVHMLVQFTSKDPALMQRMRRLWILWDSPNIELTARYIRSQATEQAARLSSGRDVDYWRLNCRWLDWAQGQWGEHTVDRYASEIAAQLPGYLVSRGVGKVVCGMTVDER